MKTKLTFAAAAWLILMMAAWAQTPLSQYKIIDLGPYGGTYSQAFYVNSQGVTSGMASLTNGNVHAILWQNGFNTDLGTLGGPDSMAGFGSPNVAGQVVGAAETANSDPNNEDFCGFAANLFPSSGSCRGVLWQNGTMTALPTLGGSGASDLIGDSIFHGFVWTRSGGMQDIAPVSGDTYSVALAINDAGSIVGTSLDANFTPRAFLVSSGASIDLNDLVPSNSLLHLLTACSVNMRGEIAGLAVDNSTGEYRGYLAIPVGSDR